MLNRVISSIVSKIKGESYILDDKISSIDIIIICKDRLFQIIRGTYKGLFFKKHKGLFFCGKSVKISHARHIYQNGTLLIGDNCQINALSKGGIFFGSNVSICSGTIIECTGVVRALGEKMVVGNHVSFGQNCFIEVRGTIEIGDDCIFAPSVSIAAENHNFNEKSIPIRLQGETRKGIHIGRNCWIGTKATILDGVTIGNGCVIAAGAVVTKDVEPYSVVAGVPARKIKTR